MKTNLDRDYEVAAVLEEELGVESDDPGLVGLGDVGEDAVDHRDEHAVLVGVPRVLNDGHHVSPLLRHVQQVAAGPEGGHKCDVTSMTCHDEPVGELDGVDHALGPHHVGHVADGGAGGGAQVQHLER